MEDLISKVFILKGELDLSPPKKDKLDEIIFKRLISHGLLRKGMHDRAFRESKIVDGGCFIRSILPFSAPFYDSQNSSVILVPCERVLGGNYRNYEEPNSDIASKIACYFDRQSENNDPEAAKYIQVGEFPLYVAWEGKNRVTLYRNINRQIKASVSKSPYPKPEELELVRFKPFGVVGIKYKGNNTEYLNNLQPWQHLKIRGNLFAVLPFKESVVLLEKYGVSWGSDIFSLMAPYVKRKIVTYVAHRCYVT